ncbi:MAG: hypothetical protein AAFR96_10725, partial [Planctomycetota bacterium]
RDANFYGTGLSRIVTGASVVPFRLPDATDANGDPIVTGALGTGSGFDHTIAELGDDSIGKHWEEVGFAQVFSGKTNEPIGGQIWGHSDRALYPHEISFIEDIDGDGNTELLLSANSSHGGRGSVSVYSYSDQYYTNDVNAPTNKRWVCILQIVGNSTADQIAYEIEDQQPDVNGDGVPDITFASRFWHMATDTPGQGGKPLARTHAKRGSGWVFLMPDSDVFTTMQADASWPALYPSATASDPEKYIKAPIVLSDDQYSMCVMKLKDVAGDKTGNQDPDDRVGEIGDLAAAGDIDGDGQMDWIVTAGHEDDHGNENYVLYGYLSYNGVNNADSSFALTDTSEAAVFVDCKRDGNGDPILNSNGDCIETFVTYNTSTNVPNELIMHDWVERPAQPGLPTTYEHGTNADFVITPGTQRSMSVNRGSIVGRQLDGELFTDTSNGIDESSPADMAIIHFSGSNPSAFQYGHVNVFLDLPEHFGSGKPIRTEMDAYSSGPLEITYDHSSETYTTPGGETLTPFVVLEKDKVVGINTVPVLGYHAANVDVAGNMDGDANGDAELAIGMPKGFNIDGVNGQDLNVSLVRIIDIGLKDYDDDASTPDEPFGIVMTIQGESPYFSSGTTYDPDYNYDATDPLSGVTLDDSGVSWSGMKAEGVGDQDGDGRDDLMLLASSLGTIVNKAVIPSTDSSNTSSVPITHGTNQRPYMVDGGATYVVLTPPAEADLNSHLVSLNVATDMVRVSMKFNSISPAVPAGYSADDPASSTWDQLQYRVRFNEIGASMPTTWQPVTATYNAATGRIELVAEFPLADVNDYGDIEVETRSKPNFKHAIDRTWLISGTP